MTSRNRLSLTNKPFFIVGESIARYPGLTAFYRTFAGGARVQVLEEDPVAFVGELHARWMKSRPAPVAAGRQPLMPASEHRKGGIFISYVREDADAARRLCDALTTIGGDVWLDERRLQPGYLWEEEILTSIRRDVGLFLPMISKQHRRARRRLRLQGMARGRRARQRHPARRPPVHRPHRDRRRVRRQSSSIPAGAGGVWRVALGACARRPAGRPADERAQGCDSRHPPQGAAVTPSSAPSLAAALNRRTPGRVSSRSTSARGNISTAAAAKPRTCCAGSSMRR